AIAAGGCDGRARRVRDEYWSEVRVYAQPYDDNSVSPKSTQQIFSEYNTSKKGESEVITTNSDEDDIFIPLNSSNNLCPDFVTHTNYIKFENHNRTRLLYYDITEYDETGSRCRINITPSLSHETPSGTKVEFYNNSRPNGWFAINVGLFEGKNNITATTLDYFYNGFSNLSKTVHAVYDNGVEPNITEEYIEEQINDTEWYIDFDITDDSKVNIDSLQIHIGNLSTFDINQSFDLDHDNLSCVNNTPYQDNYTCTIIFDTVEEGYWDFVIQVNDTFDNQKTSTFYNYYKYFDMPQITRIDDQGNIKEYSINETNFYFNWSLLPPNPNVLYYNFSIGVKPYPQEGWNSTVSDIIIYPEQISKDNNSYSAWIDFRHCDVICKPVDSVKYYLNMKTVTNIGESSYQSSDGIIFVDDQKPTTPKTHILDVFNENFTTSEEYLRINFSSQDYSNIDKYEVIISREKYLETDGSTFILPENLMFQDEISAQTANELILNSLSLEHSKGYYIHVRAKDNIGLWSNFSIKDFTVDTTPVENDSLLLSDSIQKNYNIRINKGNDNESGILWQRLIVKRSTYENDKCSPGFDNTYYTELNPSGGQYSVTLEHGWCYNFQLKSKNNAGLTKTTYGTGSTYNKSIPLDLTPPISPENVIITSGNGVVTHEAESLSFEFDKSIDPESGVKRYEYWLQEKESSGIYDDIVGPLTVDDNDQQKITRTIDLSKYGLNLSHGEEYRIKVRAYNNFNSSPSKWNYSDDITYTDITPPDILGVGLEKNMTNETIIPFLRNETKAYNITNRTINITIQTDELNSYCRYADSRLLYEDMADPQYFEVNKKNVSMFLNFGYGINELYVLCSDQQGNHMDLWDALHIKLILDNRSPKINISSPIQNEVYSRKIQYEIYVDDEISDINSTWYELTNQSDKSQVFSQGTINETRGYIKVNSSFSSFIENVTLKVYSKDSRNNTGMNSTNFTLDTSVPIITFINPALSPTENNVNSFANEETLYLMLDVENASVVNVNLFGIENGTKLLKNYTYKSTNNTNFSILENINASNLTQGKYRIEVFASNNISVNKSNNISQDSYLIYDTFADKYGYIKQIDSYGIEADEIYNNNTDEGYFVNLSVGWYDPIIDTNTSGENTNYFEVWYGLNGTNTTKNNLTTEENYFILNKEMLFPGRDIYWKSYSEDGAGNINSTEIKSFYVYNRDINKTDELLPDTESMLYLNETEEIDMKNYYSDPDYYTPQYYFNDILNSDIINYSINDENISIKSFGNKTGTQRVEVTISDGLSNITQYFEYTYTNFTNFTVEKLSSENLMTRVITQVFGKKEDKLFFNDTNFSGPIAQGISDFQFIFNHTGIISLQHNGTEENLNFSINYSQINLSDMNLSNLEKAEVSFDNSKRYRPIIAHNYSLNNTENKTTKIMHFVDENKDYKTLKIAIADNQINYSQKQVVDMDFVEYNENISYMESENLSYDRDALYFIVEDRSTSEKCGNDFDDDYDGLVDEGCTTTTDTTGTSGGSSSGSYSSGFTSSTTDTEETNDTDDSNITFKNDTSDEPEEDESYYEENERQQSDEDLEDTGDEKQTVKEPYEERPEEEYLSIDLKPIFTGAIFILIISLLAVALVKNPWVKGNVNLSLKERIEYLSSKTSQKYNNNIDNDILSYINYALQNNHEYEDARRRLIEHGFAREKVDSHISYLKQRETDIHRIKNYLTPRWDNKDSFNTALKDLEKVGWSKEYIEKAVNNLIEEKEENNKI
ncbi:MAG: hypothetical protein R6V50_02350, partial [Thermoplasmatota archaeon]